MSQFTPEIIDGKPVHYGHKQYAKTEAYRANVDAARMGAHRDHDTLCICIDCWSDFVSRKQAELNRHDGKAD